MKPLIHVALFLFLLLSGCGLSKEQIAAQTATQQTALAGLWTATPTPNPTPTRTATAAPSLTPSPAPSATPTAAAVDAGRSRFTREEVTFSLAVPEGWTQADDPDHLFLSGPTVAKTGLILAFSLDQYSMLGDPMDADEMGVALFSAHVQDSITEATSNVVQVSEDFLQNTEGDAYFRWEMEHTANGTELHQVFYIFGTGKWFLTVMFGRPKSGGAEYDARIDAAMNTLRFEK